MTKLTRLTDSGFLLHHEDTTIAFDVGEYCDPGLLAGHMLSAAIFTHSHVDHCDVSKLPNTSVLLVGPADLVERLNTTQSAHMTRVISPNIPMRVYGFEIEAFPVNHGNISAAIENFGFLITVPTGKRIWFAGDICRDLTPSPSGALDAVIVPIGGTYVFNATEALSYLEQFSGEFVAIGVHYDYAPEEASVFLAADGKRGQRLVLEPGASIVIGRA